MLEQFDINIFYFINKTCHNKVLDIVVPYFTNLGSGEFIFLIALVMLFLKSKRVKFSGIALFAGLTLTYYVVHLLKDLIQRPRPFMVLGDVNTLVTETTFSFPSNHSATAFMAACILAACFKKYSVLFYITAILVALSRPYVGVHYPSDILVGACIGILIGHILVREGKKLLFYENESKRENA